MLSKAPRYRGLGADPETVLAPTVTSVPKVPPMKSTPNWKTAAQAAPPVQAVLPSLDALGPLQEAIRRRAVAHFTYRSKRRLVATIEWLRLWPNAGPLPQL